MGGLWGGGGWVYGTTSISTWTCIGDVEDNKNRQLYIYKYNIYK